MPSKGQKKGGLAKDTSPEEDVRPSGMVLKLILLKIELLRKVDLFRYLPRSLLLDFAEHSRDIMLQNNEILFEEGSVGSKMYVILSGKILIFKGAKNVATLNQGDYFGEMALIDSKERSASAKALGNVLVMEIDESLFYKNIASDSKPLLEMVRTFSGRVRNDLDLIARDVTKLGSFTHDMRNCLVPLGIAEALLHEMTLALEGTMKDHKKRKGWEKVRKCFDTVLSVRNNLLTLIGQSMAYATKTKVEYVKAEMDILPLIKETGDEMSYHKNLKGKQLLIQSQKNVKKAMFNYLDIKRVLQNLLINAGYVTEEDGKIEIKVENLEEVLEISVTDYGCGIPEEVQPLLFKENFTTKPDGNGFGLLSCREIIEEYHQGKIWFESSIGVGTTFHFTIPYTSGN